MPMRLGNGREELARGHSSSGAGREADNAGRLNMRCVSVGLLMILMMDFTRPAHLTRRERALPETRVIPQQQTGGKSPQNNRLPRSSHQFLKLTTISPRIPKSV